MKVHPLKDSLINELHNRPFPVVTLPAQVSSMVLLNSDSRELEIARLVELAKQHRSILQAVMQIATMRVSLKFDLRWERHSEFSTYTVIRQLKRRNLFVKIYLTC